MVLLNRRAYQGLKAKTPQILLLIIIIFVIAVILFDTLEDTVIEGGLFSGTPLATIYNFVAMLTSSITSTISSWGYEGIFLLMLLESSSLPIPSEVILPFSGYLVSQGILDFWIAVLVSTIAGLIGSLVDYCIGLKGADWLARHKILDRLLFSEARLSTAQRWFNRYGGAAVFLSRMIPGFRTLVSFPAGASRMSLTKFVTYTAAGCLIWDIFLIYLGVILGNNWKEAAGVSRYLIIAAFAALFLTFLALWMRRRARQKRRPV